MKRIASKIIMRDILVLLTGISCFLISAAGLQSCSKTAGESSSSGSPISASRSSETSISGEEVSSEPVVSGTLRLWMQQPTSMHPLSSSQYQWTQICNLLYESLYEVNSDQKAMPELADETAISADGLTYTIRLKANVLFHDNTALDSADVAATVQFIQNPANASVYSGNLANVAAVNALDSLTVQFVLRTLDPFFLYELSFPILSSESIADPAVSCPPGTGPFCVTAYQAGVQLDAALFTAHRSAGEYKIQKIAVLILKDTKAAMEAFGDDRVDLVLLRDASYETYYLRNDVKIDRYPSSRFLFFEMGQNAGKILSDDAKADYVKTLLCDPMLLDGIKSVFCTSNAMPFLSTSPFVHANSCADVIPIASEANPFQKEGKKLEIIYLQGDMVKEKLISQLKKLLEKRQVPSSVVGCDAEAYAQRLASGAYDIALREAALSCNPDPSWLYLSSSLRALPGTETLKKSGNAAFQQCQTMLTMRYITPGIEVAPDNFCALMNQACRYGPFYGVGFRICGVMQSKRIKGQLEPNAFNQYNNLKEVWVWSGQ